MDSVPGNNKSLYIHTLERPSAEKLRFVLIFTRHKLYSLQTERQIRISVQLT